MRNSLRRLRLTRLADVKRLGRDRAIAALGARVALKDELANHAVRMEGWNAQMRAEPCPELEVDHAREGFPLPIESVVDLDNVNELGIEELDLG
jgi:hypothetical protein